MPFYVIPVLLLLQFQFVINVENSCGCGANRYQDPALSENIDIGDENTKKFCSLNSENQSSGDNMLIAKPHSIPSEGAMVLVPTDKYQVGTDDIVIESDNEGPKRIVEVKSFYMDRFEVSNRDFMKFASATDYMTEAEVFGDSFVFTLFLNQTFRDQLVDFRAMQAPWWYKVSGANWRHPYGPDSDLKDMLDHPVIHVSWNDAQAYCKWRGGRLPSESEWEAACRGGKHNTKYPWGDKLFPDRTHMANIWQGTFPNHNSGKDSYIGTNPVDKFLQNDFGLFNMAGNVWEWVEDMWADDAPTEKVKKGGSYLCHRSYCYRYRCSARSHNSEDSSAGNLGFRCAKSL